MMLNLTKNLKICWEIHLQAALLNIILSGEKLKITDHHYIRNKYTVTTFPYPGYFYYGKHTLIFEIPLQETIGELIE